MTDEELPCKNTVNRYLLSLLLLNLLKQYQIPRIILI